MRARVCVGTYAKTSYYFERLDISVFCMEELVYCLKEYAFLIGDEIMSDAMLHFIGVECQVPKLAKRLHSMVHEKGSLSMFVSAILEYVGLFDRALTKEIESTVCESCGRTEYEKQKAQIDYLAERKKYEAAIEGYREIIDRVKESDEDVSGLCNILSDLYYNKAVVYTQMMLYEPAATEFWNAYELKKDAASLRGFFLAKRFCLSQQEYVDLVAQYSNSYEIILDVESQIEQLERSWQETKECTGLSNMRKWRIMGDKYMYYEESIQIVEALKEEYRG